MSRYLFLVPLVLIALSPVWVPAAPVSEEPEASSPPARTLIDALDREVTLPDKVERVVMLPIPMPSVFFTVDGTEERIAGMHPSSRSHVESSVLKRMAPGLLDVPTGFVTKGFEVNLEEVLRLSPDLVFQWFSVPKEVEKLEAAGLPVIAVGGGGVDFRAARDWIRLAGAVAGKEDRLEALLSYHEEVESMVVERLSAVADPDRPRAMVLNVPPLQARAYTWLETAGARNVAAEMPNWISEVNIEQIYAWDPQIIWITNFCEAQPEDLYENRIAGYDFGNISAVKDRRVYKIPMGAYRWDPPSQESPLMLLWLAKTHHPALFADVNVREEVREFYDRFYGYTLSEEELDAIFHSPGTRRWTGW